MTVTNCQSGTNVHEIADGIYRINTPVVFDNGNGFSFRGRAPGVGPTQLIERLTLYVRADPV